MDAKSALIFAAACALVAFALLGYNGRFIGSAYDAPFQQLFRSRRSLENECFRVLIAKEEMVRLTSPGYPDAYPPNTDCQWLLTTLDENDTISLIIDTLVIERERHCLLDYLQVYLGSDPATSPFLGRFCGTLRDRVLDTNSSRVLLVFHSDAAYEDKGFAVDYYIKSTRDCRKSMAGDSGSFSSPGFPTGYPDQADCSTLIEVKPGRKVALHFDSVDLEPEDSCAFDYVRIHDGSSHNATLLGQICQGTDARTFQSSSNSLLVHFHSDDSINRRGFRARYNSVDARRTPVGDCLWEAGEKNGSVSSPNYPENYPSFANCSLWLLAPAGQKVLLKFEVLLLEIQANCSYDFLQIEEGENGNVLGRFCGRASEPRHLMSNDNEVRMRFQSDDFAEFLGFKFTYEFVKAEADLSSLTGKEMEESVDENDDREEDAFEFNVTPRSATLALGSSHGLHCGTEHPNAKIRWLKGETFLGGENPLPSLQLLPNDTLWIQSMDHQLAGRYTCVAVSTEGAINATADVRVEGSEDDCKLAFTKTPWDAEVEEGEFVVLECVSPVAHVTWEFEGRPLESSRHVTVLKTGHVLLDGAEPDDAGLYTCVARAAGCERRTRARLTVRGRPHVNKICGIPRVDLKKAETANLVGGNDAQKGAHPWQVMLWSKKRSSFCGATLLDDRWILTAAHCVDKPDIPWYDIRIKLGKYDRENDEDEEFETSIAQPSDIKMHPGYSKRTMDNDVALVRMRERAPFTTHIVPACLGDRNLSERLLSSVVGHRKGTVIGWGRLNEQGGLPRFLQEISLPLVRPDLCRNSTSETVTRNMFCAGYAQETIGDACKGDSGGPFLMRHEGRWYVVGIVSWGEGCGRRNKYGFYTRVANHLAWIRGYVKSSR